MLLTIKNLNVHFHNDSAVVKAVENLNMQISCGEIIGLIGESGSGKSTIALSILNLLPSAGKIVSGEVLFSGKNLSIMPETELRKIRGKDIAMIFQDPAAYLNPVIRVGKQIAEPLIIHTGWPLKKALIKAQTLLSDLGVSDASSRIRNYPFELSGGQKQRVMIAMA
ncbi:MAG: ABC transporter ATP-binding protein, partial [Candidatus Aureabacteria bacterium]|nr:ABC transporter ATP-binding protein [Candidatus Auribacterota bacterium]